MHDSRKKIGIIGCGAIGSSIARAIDSRLLQAELAGLCDADEARVSEVASSLKSKPPVLNMEELIEESDIVVECAQVSVVPAAVKHCIEHGKDLVVMSVGGVAAEDFELFENSSSNLYLPSGAVCGIDGMLASSLGDIQSMTLTTSKPPAGLKGAPYLDKNNISLDNIATATVIFEGSPADAIKGFPKNVNVSTTLALASQAGAKFTVRVIADPASSGNVHEVELKGSLGNISLRVENKPSPENPKTSALAYYSVIALLKKLLSHVKIGT